MYDMALLQNNDFNLVITPHARDGFHVQAPSLARVLGFRDVPAMICDLLEAEKGMEEIGGQVGAVPYVTEVGFYRTIVQRQVDEIIEPMVRQQVERLQAWAFSNVLTAIRLNGLFPEAASARQAMRPRTYTNALRLIADDAERNEHGVVT